MHRSTHVLLSVAVGLNCIIGSIVVNHAGPVDSGNVELVNQVETLGLANFLGTARLALSVPLFPFSATLTASAVFLFLSCPIDDRRVRVSAWAAISAFGAMHRSTWLWRASRSRWAARRSSLPFPLLLV
jgi:hypothetical protein